MMKVACVNRGIWHNMLLVENPTVPEHGYVITDGKDTVLAGGNLRTNEIFTTAANGEGQRIHARKDVIDTLVVNAAQIDTAREELAHGARLH